MINLIFIIKLYRKFVEVLEILSKVTAATIYYLKSMENDKPAPKSEDESSEKESPMDDKVRIF